MINAPINFQDPECSHQQKKKKCNWLTNKCNRCAARNSIHLTDLYLVFLEHLLLRSCTISPVPAAKLLISIAFNLIYVCRNKNKPNDSLEQRLLIKEPSAFTSVYSWIWGGWVFLLNCLLIISQAFALPVKGCNLPYGTGSNTEKCTLLFSGCNCAQILRTLKPEF